MVFNADSFSFSEILSEIRSNHLFLLDSLEKVEGVLHQYSQAKPLLRELEQRLLKHLGLQNAAFYDELLRRAIPASQDQKIIHSLKQDVIDLKVQFLTFFDDHPADMGDIRPRNVIQHFQVLSNNIMARIKMEREYLCPLLEKGDLDD